MKSPTGEKKKLVTITVRMTIAFKEKGESDFEDARSIPKALIIKPLKSKQGRQYNENNILKGPALRTFSRMPGRLINNTTTRLHRIIDSTVGVFLLLNESVTRIKPQGPINGLRELAKGSRNEYKREKNSNRKMAGESNL
jgi:hypothetical protein